MKRLFVVLVMLALMCPGVVNAGPEEYKWGVMVRDYDSLGVYTIQDDAGGTFTSLDTITTWFTAFHRHTTSDALSVLYKAEGGGTYTYAYLWAYPTSTPHADSTKGYVTFDQSIGGNAVWVVTDSVSITTASTAAGKKVTLNGMPYFRIRTQGADATDKSTGVNVLIKVFLIK